MKNEFENILSELTKANQDASDGYFGPESMTWKLYREPSIVLGSMRALLLQIAHPCIAMGVAKYSNFQKDFPGRAHRTFLSMVRIWFGDIQTANNSARRLHHIHSMIRGQMVWETEDETIIKPFCAADPELLYWVLATLIDTTIVFYEKTVRQLSDKEKETFYQESKITAQLMGIPLDEYPENMESFYQQYEEVLKNGTLQFRAEGQAIKKALFQVPWPLRKLNEIMAIGYMPESVKKLFNFSGSKSIFKFIISLSRLVNWLTPNDFRYAPHYHQAMFRIALSNRKRPRWIERLHYWLSTHVNWYFISNKLTIKRT